MRSRLSSPAIVTSKRGMGSLNKEVRAEIWNLHLSHQRDLDSRLLQSAQIRLRNSTVGDDFLERRGRSDQRQAAAAKFARVANGHRFFCDLNHHAIDFRFQQVRRAEAVVHIETVHAEK